MLPGEYPSRDFQPSTEQAPGSTLARRLRKYRYGHRCANKPRTSHRVSSSDAIYAFTGELRDRTFLPLTKQLSRSTPISGKLRAPNKDASRYSLPKYLFTLSRSLSSKPTPEKQTPRYAFYLFIRLLFTRARKLYNVQEVRRFAITEYNDVQFLRLGGTSEPIFRLAFER